MRKLFYFILFCTYLSNAQTAQIDTVNVLNNITIYGVRSNKTSPISKTLLSKKSLQKTSHGGEISNFLNKTPNVTMSSDNGTPFGYTYFRVRGLDQAKINMTLNSVPLNDAEDQGAFLSNYPGFIDNIQSIEIQRGVGTSTNGVSSFAGSINFSSSDGTEKNSNLKYTVGAFETIRTSGTYSSGLSKNGFALYANTSYYQSNGYRYNSGGNGRSIFLSGGYFSDKNRFKFTSFIGNSRNQMAWLSVSETDINSNPRTNYNSNDHEDNFTSTFLQLEYTHKFSEKLKLHTSGFYTILNGSYDYAMISANNVFLNSDFFGGLTNLNYTNNNFKLDFGTSVNSYTRYHNYSNVDGLFNTSNNNYGVKNEVSSYLKASYKIGKLYVSGDLQYRYVTFDYKSMDSDFSQLQWEFFNPKAGLTYQFNSGNNLYLSIGKSNREPTRTNIFGGSDYLINFSNIKSESVIDYELGVNHLSKNLSLQSNIFYMDFKDEISLIGGISSSGVGNTRSVNKSYRAGLELNTSYKIYPYLTFYCTESYTKTQIADGVNTAQHILTPAFITNLRLSFEKRGFLIEAVSKSQSSNYLNLENDKELSSFAVFDMNLGYSHQKYSVLFSLNNITSQKYFTNGYATGGERYLYANPLINGFLTLTYKF